MAKTDRVRSEKRLMMYKRKTASENTYTAVLLGLFFRPHVGESGAKVELVRAEHVR
jgi:hypothetical protein